jgi:hypothetical protein
MSISRLVNAVEDVVPGSQGQAMFPNVYSESVKRIVRMMSLMLCLLLLKLKVEKVQPSVRMNGVKIHFYPEIANPGLKQMGFNSYFFHYSVLEARNSYFSN